MAVAKFIPSLGIVPTYYTSKVGRFDGESFYLRGRNGDGDFAPWKFVQFKRTQENATIIIGGGCITIWMDQ